MNRRSFLGLLPAVLIPTTTFGHSPWGQYAVYRQKHLLVLSTRDDPASYYYSKLLVNAINKGAPEASARPARAVNLERAYNLLRTNQFQFALLSQQNILDMRQATGTFSGKPAVDLRTIYRFGDLEFVVLAQFPDGLVEVVADALLSSREDLPGAITRDEALKSALLHPGARRAIIAD